MNAVPVTAARPLLDMLGARWRVGAATTGVAWDVTTGLAGFALSDGTLALVHPLWEGAPALRLRAGGGSELVPGTAPAPPAARVKAHQGACLAVAADPDGGFLTGGSDGRVTWVQADGSVRAIAHHDGPIALLPTGAGRWRACAVRNTVYRLGGAASHIDVAGSVASFALHPGGARLAIGHEGGVTLWAGGGAPQVLAAPGLHHGLAWSNDARFLASFTPDGTLHAWQMSSLARIDVTAGATVSSLGPFVADGSFVAGASGRVVCWHPLNGELTPCGAPNQAAVTCVATHPHRRVVAAGYANGVVVLCQPGSASLLLLRAAGEGAVSALRFSLFGSCLAMGTDGGDIGVLELPDTLFRDKAGQQ